MSEKKYMFTVPMGASRDQIRRQWEDDSMEDLPEEVQAFLSERMEEPVPKDPPLSKLEGPHVLTMIEYIDSHSPLTKSDVYSNISRSSGTARKLEDLRDMGIIKIYTTGRTNLNVIVITPKGKRVAEIIRGLADTLENWEEPVVNHATY